MPNYCTYTHTVFDSVDQVMIATQCTTMAVFGPKGGLPIACAKHKGTYVDVCNPMCCGFVDGKACPKRASFAEDGSRAIYCFDHRRVGMINVATKRCKAFACSGYATYGFPIGVTPARGYTSNVVQVCRDHRLDGMVSTKRLREANKANQPSMRARKERTYISRALSPVVASPTVSPSAGGESVKMKGRTRSPIRSRRKHLKPEMPVVVQTVPIAGVERILGMFKSQGRGLFMR